jgi:hypothetical protein
MNKLLYLFTALAGLFLFTACGDDDEPTHNTLLTRSYTLLNHVTDATTGNVLAVTKGSVNYKIDVTNLVGDANFGVKLDGSNETPFSLSGVKLENPSYGIYKFADATPAASITGFTGLVDFNEESTQLSFITGGKYRVCATLPEIFYLNCNTVSTHTDGTSVTHKDDKPMYQFEINPDDMTAKVIVMCFNDPKQYRYIVNCIGDGATVTPTPEGYTITAEKLITTTTYNQGQAVTNDANGVEDDGTEATQGKPKKLYIIYNLNAKLNIFTNSFQATFQMGQRPDISMNVTTDGTVY